MDRFYIEKENGQRREYRLLRDIFTFLLNPTVLKKRIKKINQ